MLDCDVLVIGGGPAGSTFAWALRNSGLNVHLLDRKAFPRDKVCAGWITPAVVDSLKLDLADYQKQNILQPVFGFRVSRIGGKEVQPANSDTPVSYSIRRCEFDNYLLRRSEVNLHENVAVESIERDVDRLVVNQQFRTRLLVGAGGHFCPVARFLGARPGSTEMSVTAQEIEFKMTAKQSRECPVKAEVPELFFCEDLKGYGWVVRKGDYLNIGLGREDSRRLSQHVNQFCRFLQDKGKIPQDLPGKFHGHAYLLYPHAVRKVLADNVLLIGDAAGLAYAQSGEGIRPAIESALMAADVVSHSDNMFDVKTLQQYEAGLKERFGNRVQQGITDSLPDWLVRYLGGKLLGMNWFVRNMVMDRWFLHKYQAPLLYTP